MIVRILFWIGALPWILLLVMAVLLGIAGVLGGSVDIEAVAPLVMFALMSIYWTVLFWVPAIVYRFLFARRRTRDA